jgi:hypothetical protein
MSVLARSLLILAVTSCAAASPKLAAQSGSDFVLVAVSGTLQEGFPLRPNLDFVAPGERVNAIFVGNALIRGLKAHLDIKDAESREFKPASEGRNPINPAMMATGDRNDANIYAVYLVDRRQAVKALLNEPRFLSMTPDLAMVDINAEETSPRTRAIILQAAKEDPNAKSRDYATILTVVSTWRSCHFVTSPVLYTKSDGTRVTDFPNSLARFASVTDQLRTEKPDAYNGAVESAVRAAVAATAGCTTASPISAPPASDLAWYGASKGIKRMIQPYSPCEFAELAKRAQVEIPIPQCPN